ncbi:plasmid replication initiator RepA [Escherichia coli]|uniref:plasmid replication initiator RepA n=1 Tax=Escherichia coli TaxID=562 RepID=UPI00203B33F5|nr:plasmid replication initiator RepA [Escherichia coli]
MTDHNQQSSCKYVQVNNPEPVFTVPQDYTPWPFSLKLMVKANGFTESFSFDIASAMSRRDGIRKRKPPFLRRRAMNALLMAMCFYYDPLSNKVLRSLREIALECGLATKSLSGEVSITRAIRALESLEKILNLLPAHRIAIQLLRFFSPLSCSNFLAYFHSL